MGRLGSASLGRPFVLGATAVMVVTQAWGFIAVVVAVAGRRSRGSAKPILALTGSLGADCVAVSAVLIERQDAPFPGAGPTDDLDHLHRLTLTAGRSLQHQQSPYVSRARPILIRRGTDSRRAAAAPGRALGRPSG